MKPAFECEMICIFMLWLLPFSLVIFEAHINTLFIINMKILDMTKWPYNHPSFPNPWDSFWDFSLGGTNIPTQINLWAQPLNCPRGRGSGISGQPRWLYQTSYGAMHVDQGWHHTVFYSWDFRTLKKIKIKIKTII